MRKLLAILCLWPSLAFAGNPGVITTGTVTAGDVATFVNAWTIKDNGAFPISGLATIGANTMLGNWTGSTAAVTANTMPSCAADGSHALTYTNGTGIVCTSVSGSGGTVTLGTSASVTNPQRTSEASTGFYSATDQTISVAANGVQVEQWNTVATGVDYFSVTPSPSAGPGVILATAGSDTNVPLYLEPKGNGQVQIQNSNTGLTQVLSLKNTNSSGYTDIGMYDDANTLQAQFAVGGTSSGLNYFYIQQFGNLPIAFYTNGSERMRVLGGGGLAIGQTSAIGANLLSVNGGVADSSETVSGLGTFGTVDIGSTAAATAGTVLDMSNATSSMLLPQGTTAQRPGTPANGMARYNSTLQTIEAYYNAAWLVLQPLIGGGLNISASGSANSAALQAQINAMETLGVTTLATDWGINGIQLTEGHYTMTTGITMPPWIKLISSGTVELDFSTATAITQATNAQTVAGTTPGTNDTLHFASVPAACVAGAVVKDTTHAAFLPTNTQIKSKTSTTIVMTGFVTGGTVASGDTISCSFIAFNINNDTVPTGSFTNFENAANISPFLNGSNGTILVLGPGNTTNSIGMIVGSASTSPATDANVREIQVDSVVFANWGNQVELKADALYMLHFIRGGALHCAATGSDGGNGIITSQGASNVNSGEGLLFDGGWVIDGCTNAVLFDTPNIETTFDGTHLDFNTVDFSSTANDGFTNHTCNNCHFEASGTGSVVTAAANQGNLRYNIKGGSITADNAQPLFTGPFNLDMDAVQIQGYANQNNVSGNLLMASSTVVPIRMSKLTWTNFIQLTAYPLLANDDPCNAQTTVGNNILSAPPPTIVANGTTSQGANTGITATIASTPAFTTGPCSTSKTLKFTETNTTNNFTILFDRFPVKPGDILVPNVVFQTTKASSTAIIVIGYMFSYCNASIAPFESGYHGDTLGNDGSNNTWLMLSTLDLQVVPVGVCYAQMIFNTENLAASEVVSVGFEGVSNE